MTTYSFLGGSNSKVSACHAGDPGSIRWLGRSPGEGSGSPLQYSCLENPMNTIAKSLTRLNDFTFLSFLVTTSMNLRTRANRKRQILYDLTCSWNLKNMLYRKKVVFRGWGAYSEQYTLYA